MQGYLQEHRRRVLVWHAAEKAPEEGKNQPVLPWMRLPVKIEAGQGVPLMDVRGLDERLQDALKACELPARSLYRPC